MAVPPPSDTPMTNVEQMVLLHPGTKRTADEPDDTERRVRKMPKIEEMSKTPPVSQGQSDVTAMDAHSTAVDTTTTTAVAIAALPQQMEERPPVIPTRIPVSQHPIVAGRVNEFMSRSSKRELYSATCNATCSLANTIRLAETEAIGVPYTINAETEPRKDTAHGRQLIERIRHHAHQRINLFYYLCVAYYNEGYPIDRDKTCIQHGVGPFYGWAAAHSCILPATKDGFVEAVNRTVRRRGITPGVQRRLQAHGVPNADVVKLKAELLLDENKKKIFDLKKLMPDIGESFISRKSPFFQAMNSTVSLPTYVNEIDSAMERHMRKKAVNLLNEVTRGRLHPWDATEIFVDEIQKVYKLIERDSLRKKSLLQELFAAEQLLLTVEVELKNVSLSGASDTTLLEVYGRFVWSAYQYKSALHRVKRIKNSIPLSRTLNRRIKKFKSIVAGVNDILSLGKSGIEGQLERVLPALPAAVRTRMSELQKIATSRIPWPYDMSWSERDLDKAIEAARLQKMGSVLADMRLLSGVVDNGVRREMTEEELMDQKYQIISAREMFVYPDVDFQMESVYPKKDKD